MISYFSSKFHVWKYCKFKKLDIFRGLYFGSSLASCLLICILFFNHGLNLQVKVPSGRVVILLVCAVVLATPWILRVGVLEGFISPHSSYVYSTQHVFYGINGLIYLSQQVSAFISFCSSQRQPYHLVWR